MQPFVVRSADSIGAWLLMCALRHPDCHELRERAGAVFGGLAESEQAALQVVFGQVQEWKTLENDEATKVVSYRTRRS